MPLFHQASPLLCVGRQGKLASPRVNDDQKIHVDGQKWNSGRPHDYWILESLFYKILFLFSFFSITQQMEYTWGRPQILVDDRFLHLSSPLTTRY